MRKLKKRDQLISKYVILYAPIILLLLIRYPRGSFIRGLIEWNSLGKDAIPDQSGKEYNTVSVIETDYNFRSENKGRIIQVKEHKANLKKLIEWKNISK